MSMHIQKTVMVGLATLLAGAAVADAAISGKFSGTLSTNPNVRRQQLICDPEVEGGSTVPVLGKFSVEYDPDLNHFSTWEPGPGYILTSKMIEVTQSGYDNVKLLIDFETFFEYRYQLQYKETGYIQIGFQLYDGAYFREMGGTIPINTNGFEFVAIDGDEAGADMVALEFDSPDSFSAHSFSTLAVDDRNLGVFKVFADSGSRASGNSQDFMWFDSPNGNFMFDDGDTLLTWDQMEAAVVPEPAALGLLGLGAIAGLLRRRRA